VRKKHEIFVYPFKRAEESPEFLNRYLSQFEHHSRSKLGPVLKYFPLRLLKKIMGGNVDYIFLGNRLNYLISHLSTENILMFESFHRNSLNIKKSKNIYRFPLNYLLNNLYFIFKTDPLMEGKASQKLIEYTVAIFRITRPKALVVWNDSLFLERFLIYCARKADIKTICIQHGVFLSKTNPANLDGWYADVIYVWSEFQKRIFTDAGLDAQKVHVLGFPYKIHGEQGRKIDKQKSKICIFGQNYEDFNVALGQRKKEIFEELSAKLNEYEVVYKLHPGEKNPAYYPDNIEIFEGNMEDALKCCDYFVALTSTALIEATLAGKVAIQFFHPDFPTDKFEEIGWSYTYDYLSGTDFNIYIEKIEKPFELKEDGLLVPDDLAASFQALGRMH